MCEEIDRYNAMEGVLQKIHRRFVAIPANEKKRNNIILHDVKPGFLWRLHQYI